MTLQYISRVARHEQYLDASPQSPRFAGKLNSGHAVWHHNIAKQEIKLLVALKNPKRLRAVPGTRNLIAVASQHRRRDFDNVVIVVDQKDSLRAGRYSLGLSGFRLRIRPSRGLGQIQCNRGSRSRSAFNGDVSSGLPDKAVNHAKAQPGPLADLLGRKEGLKHPV